MNDSALWKLYDSRLVREERKVEQVVRRQLAWEAQQVAQNLQAALPAKGAGDQVEVILFNVEDSVQVFAPRMTAVLEDTYSVVQGEVFADLGVSVPIDTTPGPRQLNELRDVAARDVRRIAQTTRDLLRDDLIEGFGLGEGRDGLMSRVSRVIGQQGPRVALIAQQEAGMALSMSTFDGFQRAGIQEHRWLTQRDSRVSDGTTSPRNHRRLHGEVVKVGKRFSNGLLYPRAPGSSADESVGCRCFIGPVLTGDRGDLPGDDGTVSPGGSEIRPEPRRPRRVDPERQRAERLTWEQFGAKLPRATDRRELLEEALNRLNDLPPAARARFIEALEGIPDFKWTVATGSTKSLRRMGAIHLERPRPGAPIRGTKLELALSRTNPEWDEWVKAYNKEFVNLRGLGGNVRADRLAEWTKLNPEPVQFVFGTADEIAETLVHELGHAIDLLEEGADWGFTEKFKADGMVTEFRKAHYGYDATVSGQLVKPGPGATRDGSFTYGTKDPREAFAETVRMYFMGTSRGYDFDGLGVEVMSAEQWRERHPALARWIEDNILGGG